jgi:thiol-disulfide isomerase/thioredoxin
METQTKILSAIGLILVVAIGFSLISSDEPAAVTNSTGANLSESELESEVVMMEEKGTADEEVMMISEEKMMDESTVGSGEMMKETEMRNEGAGAVAAPTAGKYLAYSPQAVANSGADTILLTFSASWCPSCRALDKNINENLGRVPRGTEIYKVDYDTNVALRQQYGVTMQHSHVLISRDGTLIKKWSGSNTLTELLAGI